MTIAAFEAFYAEPPAGGRRLCIHTPPQGTPRGAVVQIHAFAEEMNKSRRMAALTARALARDGFAVLQIDLQGCGDSSDEFSDATWAGWTSDVAWAADWLQQRYAVPLWAWGHRAGALLADALARSRHCHLLLWNPVLQGKAVTQQFVRLKAAAQWASGDGKAAAQAVRDDLAAGRVVEIAGYGLSPKLAQALEGAVLQPVPPGAGRHVVWLEVAGREGEPTLSPAAQAQLPRWEAAGWTVQARAVAGPAFWQTVEIEDAPALVEASAELLRGTA